MAVPAFAFAGELLDCDGHLYMEPDVMSEIVGDAGASWIIDYLRTYVGTDADREARDRAREETWTIKGFSALGAFDATDRVEALDKMGVHRQLLFPNTVLRELRLGTPAARDVCRRYNDYVLDWTRRADDRARAVCQVNMTDREWALAELQRVVDGGARGVLLPCAEPPAGTSPASPLWDDFWRLLEESGTPALIHIGAGGLASAEDDDPMLPPRRWADAPALRARCSRTDRAARSSSVPSTSSSRTSRPRCTSRACSWAACSSASPGCVSARSSSARRGSVRCVSASTATPSSCTRSASAIRCCRASTCVATYASTPQWTEPVDVLVERYGIRESYVFNTDYPHIEGGRHPVESFLEMTERVGPDYTEAFFVDNGKLLFP